MTTKIYDEFTKNFIVKPNGGNSNILLHISDTNVNEFNSYAEYANKLGKQYDFNTQKDTEPLELIWKNFQTCLLQYTGKNKTAWKNYLKTFTAGSKCSYKWR
jgi:hypothetical protein